jgi:hypothetical protein
MIFFISGALIAGSELAQLIVSILLTYVGIRKYRMKFLTLGVSLLALSSFLMASPHFLFGSGQYALSFTTPQRDMIFLGSDLEDRSEGSLGHVEDTQKDAKSSSFSTSDDGLQLLTSSVPFVYVTGVDSGLTSGSTPGDNITEEEGPTNANVANGTVVRAVSIPTDESSDITLGPLVSTSTPEEFVTFPYTYARGVKLLIFYTIREIVRTVQFSFGIICRYGDATIHRGLMHEAGGIHLEFNRYRLWNLRLWVKLSNLDPFCRTVRSWCWNYLIVLRRGTLHGRYYYAE